MITMLVAIFSVHIGNGWLAIASPGAESSRRNAQADAVDKLERAKSILQEHGNYAWLTESGECRCHAEQTGSSLQRRTL